MPTDERSSATFDRFQLLGYLALCLIWGSTWLAIRIVVRTVPPLLAAGVRFALAGLVLFALAALQKRRWPRDQEQWRALAILSLTIMAVPYGLLFWAEQYVTSSMTAVLFSAMPLMVALLTPLMIHRTVPRGAVFAMVIAFGGMLYLLYTDRHANPRTLLGGSAVLLAMTLSSWSIVFAKKALREIDSVVATAWQLLFGSVALFWGTWALEPRQHAVWTRSALLAMAFLILFGSCAAFVIYYWLLKKMQPYQVATSSLVVPVIAVMEGAGFAHEPVPLTMIIVIIIILVSVASILRAEASGTQGDFIFLRERK